MWRITQYHVDGDERWAVWSTIVSDWLVAGLDVPGLIDWYYTHSTEDRDASETHIRTRVEQIRGGDGHWGNAPYQHDFPTEDALAELTANG